MKRFLIVLALALTSGAVHAQQTPFGQGGRGSFPGCPACGVISYVDLPAPEATVSASNLYFAGWGFECVSGQPTNRVDVWYQDYESEAFHPLAQPAWNLYWGVVPRPDVQAAYRGSCPNVTLNTGWMLVITNAPPTGLRRVKINVWSDAAYYETHSRTYLITR